LLFGLDIGGPPDQGLRLAIDLDLDLGGDAASDGQPCAVDFHQNGSFEWSSLDDRQPIPDVDAQRVEVGTNPVATVYRDHTDLPFHIHRVESHHRVQHPPEFEYYPIVKGIATNIYYQDYS
jgi:hypothetical protein